MPAETIDRAPWQAGPGNRAREAEKDSVVYIGFSLEVVSAAPLRSGQTLPATNYDAWLDVTMPRARIHEAVRVDLV